MKVRVFFLLEVLLKINFCASVFSIGLLWSVNPEAESVSRSMVRAFNYLASNFKTYPSRRGVTLGLGNPGAMTALSFLTDLYASSNNGDKDLLTSEFVETEFASNFPEAYHEDVFVEPGFECPYDSEIKVSLTSVFRNNRFVNC